MKERLSPWQPLFFCQAMTLSAQYGTILCDYMPIYTCCRKEFIVNSLAILILTKNEEINIVDVVRNAKKCT